MFAPAGLYEMMIWPKFYVLWGLGTISSLAEPMGLWEECIIIMVIARLA